MKLTKSQQIEKENLEWFCPVLLKLWPPQEGEFEEYLAHSERGKPIVGFQRGCIKFNVWKEAKRLRGITIHELWEESFYGDDWWPGFMELLTEEDGITPIPENIKDYIKNEIFRGKSKDLIDEIYNEICLK